jgi:hypothetical protein
MGRRRALGSDGCAAEWWGIALQRVKNSDLILRAPVPPGEWLRSLVGGEGIMPEGYASFKTGNGMYVSSGKFKSHAERAK